MMALLASGVLTINVAIAGHFRAWRCGGVRRRLAR
jgi:hypothetical protein